MTLRLLMIVPLLLCPKASFAQSQDWAIYRSETGWLNFAYPSGWEVISTDRTPSRFLENYAIQPRGQDFSGASGQVALRIFDPMYVEEQARLAPTSNKNSVFQQFVKSLPGVESPAFSTRTYKNKTYYFANEMGGGIRTQYAGFVNQHGDLDVVALATGPSDGDRWQYLLFEVAGSVYTSPTSGSGNSAENAVRNWYANLSIGNKPALMALSCRQALPSMILLYFASPDIVNIMTKSAISFNFSGLRFQTIKSGPAGAAVRVSGNIVGPNGAVIPSYQNSSFFGGSNTLFVKIEQGQWRVCGPVRGGYR